MSLIFSLSVSIKYARIQVTPKTTATDKVLRIFFRDEAFFVLNKRKQERKQGSIQVLVFLISLLTSYWKYMFSSTYTLFIKQHYASGRKTYVTLDKIHVYEKKERERKQGRKKRRQKTEDLFCLFFFMLPECTSLCELEFIKLWIGYYL